jgi:glycosyltransferase involved in cell wall biosynthesis
MDTFKPERMPRLLVLVVAYHAETTISAVLTRIPPSLVDAYHVEVLIIDDSSKDMTFEVGVKAQREGNLPFCVHVLYNPVNQGYGGNQKIGYHYAIENKFDFVALVHGDGQYAPECLVELLGPLKSGKADAVFGSRMLARGQALKGGMPIYKYMGNKILTWFENRMLKSNLSEFHSGYRLYSVAGLASVPFDLNSNEFHFDTEIIIQFLLAGLRISELPIPTYYGDEICRVNGLKYARDVVKAVLKARAQSMGLFYCPNFDCTGRGNEHYQTKSGYLSPHFETLRHVRPGSRVLDLGCAGGYVGMLLKKELGCKVTGVDCFPLAPGNRLDEFVDHDLNRGVPDIDFGQFDCILLLDVIEHLTRPEQFVRSLRKALEQHPETMVITSTGNIGFFIPRLMLVLGHFNYGKRGILDMTHCRLFTFGSFRRLFIQNGFRVEFVAGMPGPYPLALGDNALSRFVLRLNSLAIKINKGFFSYQIFMVSRSLPSLAYLLAHAVEQSEIRSNSQAIRSQCQSVCAQPSEKCA